MPARFLLVMAALLSAAAATAAPAQKAGALRILTSDLPPLAVERDPAQPGALVEIVAELTRRTGIAATNEFVPWQRALFVVGHLPRTALYPLTRTPERERHFRWLAPLYREQFVFIAEAGGVDLTDLAALRGRRIALLRGSTQWDNLQRLGYMGLIPTVSVQEGLRFVHEGMADAIYGDQAIVGHTARTLFPDKQWQASAAIVSTTTWLGGSLDLGADDAARFNRALAAMQADGSYARILRRYGLPR